jgi:hypothetical protein
MMLSTRNMLKKSLDTQRRWHAAFNVCDSVTLAHPCFFG